jgi:D-alanine transaminase
MCNIKTLCLLPNVLASEKANRVGADECVQYRAEANGIKNRVTEGAHSNVHCIKDGVLYTAPLDNLILPGIARKNIIRICARLGITVKEEPFSLDFLRSADEIIFSSSSNFCITVTELDGEKVGGKAPKLLKHLQDALLEDYLLTTNK